MLLNIEKPGEQNEELSKKGLRIDGEYGPCSSSKETESKEINVITC